MDENVVKNQINTVATVARKSQKDINLCQNVMQKGCTWCLSQDSMHYEEIRQNKPNEQVQVYQEFRKIEGKFFVTKEI